MAKLEVRVGGIYLTRDGGRVLIEGDGRVHMVDNAQKYWTPASPVSVFPFYGRYNGPHKPDFLHTWSKDGKFLKNRESELDIVVEIHQSES